MRVFYGHARAATPDVIVGDVARLTSILRTRGHADAVVTTGRDDFASAWALCRKDWPEWEMRWAQGTGADGRPFFDLVVIPDYDGAPRCGSATAAGATFALLIGKPVAYWLRSGTVLRRVEAVTRVEWGNPQSGYELTLTPRSAS